MKNIGIANQMKNRTKIILHDASNEECRHCESTNSTLASAASDRERKKFSMCYFCQHDYYTVIPEFVILEGIEEKNRFFTTNTAEDPTRLNNGIVAYEVVGYADTVEEAQIELYGRSFCTT